MLSQKEKAKELVLKFRQLPPSSPYTGVGDGEAKQCALIAVDEIIQLRKGYFDCTNSIQDESYWQEVKQEINLL